MNKLRLITGVFHFIIIRSRIIDSFKNIPFYLSITKVGFHVFLLIKGPFSYLSLLIFFQLFVQEHYCIFMKSKALNKVIFVKIILNKLVDISYGGL